MESEVTPPLPEVGPHRLNGNDATAKPSSSPSSATNRRADGSGSTAATLLFCNDDEIVASEAQDEGKNSRPVTSPPVTSPPYWPHGQTNGGTGPGPGGGGGRAWRGGFLVSGGSHDRSNHSTESVVPAGAITLQDNEMAEDDDANTVTSPDRLYGRDRNKACWAKSVSVTDYVIVNESATNIGAFVVWNIKVETLSGCYMNIRKRYSEFDELRHRLVMTFPSFEAAVPPLPPKSVIAKFRPRFLEKRRSGLQYFLNCILLNPEFSGSPVLKDFLFS